MIEISDDCIKALREAALAAGDTGEGGLVGVCHDALPGSKRWEQVADWGESRPVPDRVRAAARGRCASVIAERIAAVREIALARGDRALLGDVNMASQSDAEALSRVLATWNRRAEPPVFVIAIAFSCAYFVNVDEKHGGYLKDALVFHSRIAAENYTHHKWMEPFRPCHVVETTQQAIDDNRAMHARLAKRADP